MKKNLFVIFLAAATLVCGCQSGISYKIKGNVNNIGDIIYLTENNVVLDSIQVDNGVFTYKGTVEKPSIFALKTKSDQFALLFIEGGSIIVKRDSTMKLASITGGYCNDQYNKYKYEAYDLTMKMYFIPDLTMEERATATTRHAVLDDSMINANLNNLCGAYLLMANERTKSGTEILEAVAGFPPELTETKIVTDLKNRGEAKQKSEPGHQFTDIILLDIDGNGQSLSSAVQNNKYVLLDFWASWCKPCMEELPELIAVYKEYKDKGFTVFGVSVDSKKEAWLKVLESEELSWIQTSALTGWKNKAVDDYCISEVPTNFLIGSDGIIVAKNLHGDQLRKKLEELLQ